MSVLWNGDAVQRAFAARIRKNMDTATLYVKGEIQKSINRGNADGKNPSLPGEPPKKVTARLFQSIATGKRESPLEITGVIGTNVESAKRLELGFVGTTADGSTVSQAPRPFLRPGLANAMQVVRRILVR